LHFDCVHRGLDGNVSIRQPHDHPGDESSRRPAGDQEQHHKTLLSTQSGQSAIGKTNDDLTDASMPMQDRSRQVDFVLLLPNKAEP
jgi:hypothetical protein